MVDYEDWQTTEEFFHFVDQIWGPHTIDRFTSVSNTKSSRFNSLFWYPESEAVDAFTQNWRFVNNWLVPPIKLCRTINHIVMCKVMVLVLFQNGHQEPSGHYYSVKTWNTENMSSMILRIKMFLNMVQIPRVFFGSDRFNSRVLAVRLCADWCERHGLQL